MHFSVCLSHLQICVFKALPSALASLSNSSVHRLEDLKCTICDLGSTCDSWIMTLEIWPCSGVSGAEGLLCNTHVPWPSTSDHFQRQCEVVGQRDETGSYLSLCFLTCKTELRVIMKLQRGNMCKVASMMATRNSGSRNVLSLLHSLLPFLPSAWGHAWRSSGHVACSSYYLHVLKIQLICSGCYQSKGLSSKCLFLWTKWSTLLTRQLVVFYFGLLSACGSFFCS